MNKRGKKITIIILLLFAAIFAITLTSGKYIYNSVWNYYLKSKGFYFESDLLDINTKKNSFLKWNGNDIYFSIKNSLNQELISEYDISYKVSCSVLGDEANYIDCVLNGTNSSTFNGSLSSTAYCTNKVDNNDVSNLTKAECELSGYTWEEEISSKNISFNLILKDETKTIDEVSVEIVAESIEPYHKTLTGVFNLNKVNLADSEFIIDYQSFGEYDELSIINKASSDKCFLVSFDSNNYLYDLTLNTVLEYNTDSNKKVNQIKVKVGSQTSSSYDFYKINSEKEYSINDFIVEEKEC